MRRRSIYDAFLITAGIILLTTKLVNDQEFHLNILRQGCRFIGIAFLVGGITASLAITVPRIQLFGGILTGIIFLGIDTILKRHPNWFGVCSWVFSFSLLVNPSIIALTNIGFAAPILSIIAISPVVASLLLGLRGGIIIYFGAFICLFAVFWIDISQLLPIGELPKNEYYRIRIIAMPLILTTSFLISLVYEKSRKNNEALLKKARDEALEASKSKSLFLANISHEIRTPMNGVLGGADLLLDSQLDSSQRNIINTIIKSGESMMHILNDILDFSKIDAGRLDIDHHSFEIDEMLRSVFELYRPKAIEKGLNFELEIDESVPTHVISDSIRIRQIISNLVNNGIKFTTKGHVIVRSKLISHQSDLLQVRFEVEDTGIGIQEEVISSLFKEFFQADLSTTRQFGGTGLGLAISQRLAKLMKSEIKVESTVGKGSLFYLDLKLQTGTLEKEQNNSNDSIEVKKDTLGHLNVLLVEDNIINRELALSFLEKFGIACDTASNGQEALNLLQQNNYHVILMDCQMPIMDGYEATKAIRSLPLNKQPFIIAMTANAMIGDKEKCLAVGMDDYVSKPISKDKLYKAISRWAEFLKVK